MSDEEEQPAADPGIDGEDDNDVGNDSDVEIVVLDLDVDEDDVGDEDGEEEELIIARIDAEPFEGEDEGGADGDDGENEILDFDEEGEGEDDREEDDGDDEGGEADENAGPALPLASVVEAVLFASREPLKAKQLARAAGRGVRQDAVRAAVADLNLHYLETGRAFEIAEISGRYQLMSRPEYVEYIVRVQPRREAGEREKSSRLTPAALDTLSIIAYKQPVTRAEIERIRGVGCGPVLKALIERGSVRVAGKRADLLGQPLTYGTTDAFLVEFGLGSLDELPLRNEFLAAFQEEEELQTMVEREEEAGLSEPAEPDAPEPAEEDAGPAE